MLDNLGIGNLKDMVDRRQINQLTKNKHARWGGPMIGHSGANPWFIIDFGEALRVNPSCYTLEHSSSGYGLIRGWNFEGSMDRKTWEIIREHKDDESIQYNRKVVTFKVDCHKFYRFFRIYSTQKQHHGHWEITAVLLEMYGHTIRDYTEAKSI